MVKTLNTPYNSFDGRRNKDKHFEVQMKRVFAAFKHKPSTMLMVSIETGILRANICRYVAEWQKQGKVRLLKQGLCKVSQYRAWYYTADTNLFTQALKLF